MGAFSNSAVVQHRLHGTDLAGFSQQLAVFVLGPWWGAFVWGSLRPLSKNIASKSTKSAYISPKKPRRLLGFLRLNQFTLVLSVLQIVTYYLNRVQIVLDGHLSLVSAASNQPLGRAKQRISPLYLKTYWTFYCEIPASSSIFRKHFSWKKTEGKWSCFRVNWVWRIGWNKHWSFSKILKV